MCYLSQQVAGQSHDFLLGAFSLFLNKFLLVEIPSTHCFTYLVIAVFTFKCVYVGDIKRMNNTCMSIIFIPLILSLMFNSDKNISINWWSICILVLLVHEYCKYKMIQRVTRWNTGIYSWLIHQSLWIYDGVI